MKKQLLLFSLFLCALLSAETLCNFSKGQWNPQQWLMVKSPRWEHFGTWVQLEDHIYNAVPAQVSEKDLQGKRSPETYTSMLWKTPITAKRLTCTVTMSFDYQMAPLIVLSAPVSPNAKGIPQYAEHWEIVLYNQGLNVWHHEIRDGKPYWRKLAYVEAKFQPKTKYTLTATIVHTARGPQLSVTCGDVKFGCLVPTLPLPYYIGITGCEGINRFYTFKLK